MHTVPSLLMPLSQVQRSALRGAAAHGQAAGHRACPRGAEQATRECCQGAGQGALRRESLPLMAPPGCNDPLLDTARGALLE